MELCADKISLWSAGGLARREDASRSSYFESLKVDGADTTERAKLGWWVRWWLDIEFGEYWIVIGGCVEFAAEGR